jgi:ribosomal protein L7Ae-like RNA K-turn-binding protein
MSHKTSKKEVLRAIDHAEAEVKKRLLPKIKIKNISICIYESKLPILGKYIGLDKNDIPLIDLNIKYIAKASKEYDGLISLYEIILSTIVHEIGHALQEKRAYKQNTILYFDENEAENFSISFCQYGVIDKI